MFRFLAKFPLPRQTTVSTQRSVHSGASLSASSSSSSSSSSRVSRVISNVSLRAFTSPSSAAAAEAASKLSDFQRAEQFLSRQQFAHACNYFQSALEAVTYAPDVNLKNHIRNRLAHSLSKSGQFAKEADVRAQAVRDLETALKKNTPNLSPEFTLHLMAGVLSYAAALLRAGRADDLLKRADALFDLVRPLEVSTYQTLQLIIAAAYYLTKDAKILPLLSPEDFSKSLASSSLVGDRLRLLGLYRDRVDNNLEASIRLLTDSVALDQPAEDVMVSKLMLGEALCKNKQYKEAVTPLVEALKISTAQYGQLHPETCNVLRMIARVQHHLGDAVTAEGLFRSAVANLERVVEATTEQPDFLALQALVNTRYDYAQLLRGITWNNRSRAPEADKQIEAADALCKKKQAEGVMLQPQNDQGLYAPHFLLRRFSTAQ